MGQLVPENLMWLSWAFRVQTLFGLGFFVFICIRDRKSVGLVQAVSIVAPATCLLAYYAAIVFLDMPAVRPTWTTLWFQFSLGWFLLGLPTAIEIAKRYKK